MKRFKVVSATDDDPNVIENAEPVALFDTNGDTVKFGTEGSRILYNGSLPAVAPSVSTRFPWNKVGYSTGPDLFDLTDPSQPVALRTGLYTITANVALSGAAVAGKTFSVELAMDTDDVYVSTSSAGSMGLSRVYTSVTLSFFMTAGQKVSLLLWHDAVAAQYFTFSVSGVFIPATEKTEDE